MDRGQNCASSGPTAIRTVSFRRRREAHARLPVAASRSPFGISVQIDQDAPIVIPHPECFGLGCRGKLDINREFIERLRRSRTIAIEATDTAHQKLSLSFSLADFATAYDGPAGDPPKVRDETVTSDKMKQLTKQSEQQKPVQCEE